MPRRGEHEDDSVRLFGAPHTAVHKWLDEFHDVPGCGGVAHRKKRHHLAGVEQVRRIWGDVAADVAHRHIVMDLVQVGWDGPFPRDEKHCEELGLWVTK